MACERKAELSGWQLLARENGVGSQLTALQMEHLRLKSTETCLVPVEKLK
jgi:hypothetical protein